VIFSFRLKKLFRFVGEFSSFSTLKLKYAHLKNTLDVYDIKFKLFNLAFTCVFVRLSNFTFYKKSLDSTVTNYTKTFYFNQFIFFLNSYLLPFGQIYPIQIIAQSRVDSYFRKEISNRFQLDNT
jgi:hypothetical protein